MIGSRMTSRIVVRMASSQTSIYACQIGTNV